MTPIEVINKLAQDSYFTINGSENDDVDEDKVTFENNYIRAFNLWKDEYETETYWNVARENGYVLGTINNTVDYVFDLPAEYRTPVFDVNKELIFTNDGVVVARFAMVDPNQRVYDRDIYHADRATFIESPSGGGKIILSRAPREHELGAVATLDVVKKFPEMTRDNVDVVSWIANKQLITLGVSKNVSLSDVTKVSLSPSFAQKYANELNKAININNATTEPDPMLWSDYGYIGGVW